MERKGDPEAHADNLRYYTYLIELFNICMQPKSIIKIKRNRIVKFNVKMRLSSLPPDRAIIRRFDCEAFAGFASVCAVYLLFSFFFFVHSLLLASVSSTLIEISVVHFGVEDMRNTVAKDES